jgi:hypothetical protein
MLFDKLSALMQFFDLIYINGFFLLQHIKFILAFWIGSLAPRLFTAT